MYNPYKIAVVQHPPVFLNLSKSIDLAIQYIEEASVQETNMVVFPETWLPGYPVWLDYAPEAGIWDHPPAKALFRMLFENSIAIEDNYFKALSNAAINNNCLVVMGANERVGRTLYNTIFYFKANGEYDLHRKLMPTYTERLVWGMGDGSTLPTIDDNGTKITGLICWEHWMPLARVATHENGEQIHIAQWPMVKDLHQISCRQYAFEGQCYVIAAGCTITKQQMIDGILSSSDESNPAIQLIRSIPVKDDDFLLSGGSAVIKPNTEYLIDPVLESNTIIYADLDLSILSEGNLFIDTNGHYSRPDVFQLHVNTKNHQNVIHRKNFED